MWSYNALCDEFFAGTRLFLKLDLDPSRESVLHYFELIRKQFPAMDRMRRRDDGGLALDEATEAGTRRYVRISPQAIKLGTIAPEGPDEVRRLGAIALGLAPTALTLSDLDFDHLETVFAFDLEFAGNHDEIVCNTLLGGNPFVAALRGDNEKMIECQPSLGIALSEDCATQAYVDVKSRTNTYEVRTGEFAPALISVYLTVRRYWSGAEVGGLEAVQHELLRHAMEIADNRVVPYVVKPLAAAIGTCS